MIRFGRVCVYALLATATWFAARARAGTGDGAPVRAERLAHMLGYLDADYARFGAQEQAEHLAMVAGATRLAHDLPRSPGLENQVANVGALIESTAPTTEVHARIADLRMEVLGRYRVEQSPSTTPSVTRGRALYEQHCAVCHGVTGHADTPVAATLRPPPANFREPLFGATLSPYDVVTAIRFGIDGTPMAPVPSLGETDRWDIAFYVIGLRHPGALADVVPSFTSSELALVNDGELRDELFAAGIGGTSLNPTLNALRRRTPFEAQPGEPLAAARRELDAARVAVVRGKKQDAIDAVISAEKDGWGPAKSVVASVAPALVAAMGGRFARLADLVRSGAARDQVVAAIASTLELLAHAEHVTDGTHARRGASDPTAIARAWPEENSTTALAASAAKTEVSPQAPCAEPGFGPGPQLRSTEGGLPFDVTHDCMFPGDARLEVALNVRQEGRPSRAQVDALLRDVFEQVRSATGARMPELTHVSVFPAGTSDGRNPYGRLEFEADDGPQGEFSMQLDLPFEPAEWARTFVASRSAGFLGTSRPQVTVNEAKGQFEITYPFVEPSTDRWSEHVTYARAAIHLFPWLFDFYPPKTDVPAITFTGVRRGKPVLTVHIADLRTFLSMDPWPIRERMAAAGIPIEPDAVRTREQETVLGKEYARALAKLPKGSVVFDGADEAN